MTRLQLTVTRTNGTRYDLDETYRDTPQGRHQVDAKAFSLLDRADVARVDVERHTRVASATGRGRYR